MVYYEAAAAGIYSHNRNNRSAGQDQYAQAFQQFGLANPYGDSRYDPGTAGGSANYWDYVRDESGVYDEFGNTPYLPPHMLAPDMQHQANIISQRRNDSLLREGLTGAQSYLQSGLGNLQTYRPGGAAAMTSGLYQTQAQATLNTAMARQQDAPDLMFRYDEKQRNNANRAAKRAGQMQLIGGLVGAGMGAAAGMVGGPAAAGAVGGAMGAGGGVPQNMSLGGGGPMGSPGTMADGTGFMPQGAPGGGGPGGGMRSLMPRSPGATMAGAAMAGGMPAYTPGSGGGGAAPGGGGRMAGGGGGAEAGGQGGPTYGGQPLGAMQGMFVSPPAGPAVQQLSMQTGLDPVILHSIVTDGDTGDIAPMYEFRIQALEQQSRPQSIGETIQQWRQKDQWNGQPVPLGR